MKTRTLILSGMQSNVFFTGILNISGGQDLFCKVHCYNQYQDLCKVILKIGDKQYYAQNINLDIDYNFMLEGANIDDDVSFCVLSQKDNKCILSNNLSKEEIENITNQEKSTESEQKIESQSIGQEKTQQKVDFDESTFFDTIKEQFDDMFSKNQTCDEVEKLIPNSKWVKINCEDEEQNEHQYILGKLFNELGEVECVCYGEPAQNKEQKLLTVDPEFSQWLPLDPENENSKGYYIMYQDAKTGQTLKIS